MNDDVNVIGTHYLIGIVLTYFHITYFPSTPHPIRFVKNICKEPNWGEKSSVRVSIKSRYIYS